ncbi:fungal-specific transcription factor domain-containing protein [Mycena vulgaris]|nr:fungal-specific transcription factor domain-containing protein [Mycena vulgaris]
MSSNDEDFARESQRGKKRRIERACDYCRRRKTRCDGSIPGDKCYACLDADLECTYIEVSTRPSRARPKSYVESLEERVEPLEMQLEVGRLHAELESTPFASPSLGTHSGNSATPLDTDRRNTSHTNMPMVREAGAEAEQMTEMNKRTASLYMIRLVLGTATAPPKPAHAEDLLHLEMARKFQTLSVEEPPGRPFVGKSSGILLVKAATDFKAEVSRGELRAGTDEGGSRDSEPRMPFTSRRLQRWRARPLEIAAQPKQSTVYSFPPAELAMHLIDLYFVHVNVYLPLLHRPTVERGVATGLHHMDDGFAAILLLVCAVASRWSNDPRVMVPGGTQGVGVFKPGGRLACGWGWFNQVPMAGNHLFGRPKLYDLQYCCLAAQFLEYSLSPGACWRLVGVGIRLAQEVGAHRRTLPVEKPSVERELWKRAFLVLVYMDRVISAGTGRTCAMHHEDFDLDPLIECDEEYWEHPTHPFEQPPGVPRGLPVLYPLTKVRAYAVDGAWEELVVAELDSALNRWREQVPEHLRWDPARRDPVFFDQSVALYCAFSHVQILIHRQFIPMLRKSAPTALPSLAICTSAARMCANISLVAQKPFNGEWLPKMAISEQPSIDFLNFQHPKLMFKREIESHSMAQMALRKLSIVDVQRRRNAKIPVVVNLTAVCTSAIVLLLNVWSGKRAGLVSNASPEIANVHKCMEVIRLCEDRWESAGLIWDILYELGSIGQLPLNLNAPRMRMVEHDRGDPHQAVASNGESILPEHRDMQKIFDSHFCATNVQLAPPHSGPFAGVSGTTAGGGAASGVAPIEPSVFTPPDEWFPADDLFAGMQSDPGQTSRELDELMSLLDSDTLAMWNAPISIEADDWGNYLTNFGEITQGQQMDIPNESSHLLAPPSPAPVVDHQTLSERLAGVVRAKEASEDGQRKRVRSLHHCLFQSRALPLALTLALALAVHGHRTPTDPRARERREAPAGAHNDPRARALAREQSSPQSLRGHAQLLVVGLAYVLKAAPAFSMPASAYGRGKVARFGESGFDTSVAEEEAPAPSPSPSPGRIPHPLPIPPATPHAHPHPHPLPLPPAPAPAHPQQGITLSWGDV